jgi:hypothetical protein
MYKRNNSDSYVTNNHVHQYQTRNSSKVVVPSHKSSLLERSPYYITAKIYDQLPSLLRNIKNDVLFKTLLKKILTHKEYYNVGAFFDENTKIDEIDLIMYTTRYNIEQFS